MTPGRSMSTALVIGANGFLGSHVTRRLVDGGHEVRAMVRPNAKTVGIDDLDVTRFVGDIWDDATLREAMTGCDDVYYCVVDARGWLRDPAPLFRTNVDGTRNVLDVARDMPLRRFVFTSSYVTVGRRRGRRSTEDDVADVRRVTPYVRSRIEGEELVLRYARDRGLPAVAMCVSTTYGSGDWGAPARRDHRRRRLRQAAVRDERYRTRSGRDRRRGTRTHPGRRQGPGR